MGRRGDAETPLLTASPHPRVAASPCLRVALNYTRPHGLRQPGLEAFQQADALADLRRQTAASDQPRELTYVDIDTFLATF
jgi:hypothetical protein